MKQEKAMKIVICDDDKTTCALLEDQLKAFFTGINVKIELDVFFNGASLMEYLKREKSPDILFLDIELPGLNGIEVGKYIRNTLNNSDLFLVYISYKTEYALELFQNQPFDFLIKPMKKQQIYSVIEKILNIIGKNECIFEYKNQGLSHRIHYKDILYFQSNGRKINIITTKNKTEIFYGRLSEIEKTCPTDLFLRIHKSYLVNMRYTKNITYNWMQMNNGDILNISKSKRVEIRKKVMQYMMNSDTNITNMHYS